MKNKKIWKLFWQFFKFGIVGISNTLISYIIYTALVAVHFHYLIASVIGFICSVINSFYWNNKYVFGNQQKDNILKSFIKTFLSYAGTGLILANILLYCMVELLEVNVYLAPVINLIVTVPLNFLLNKFWVFKKKS